MKGVPDGIGQTTDPGDEPLDIAKPEMGMEFTETSTGQTQTAQFADAAKEQTVYVDSEMDQTRMGQDSSQDDLGNFFSRPVKIYEQQWATDTEFTDFIDPWTLFYEDARVKARLNNYNLLRSKLHLKFMINGNGFLYGRVLAAYLPLATFDDLTPTLVVEQADVVQYSQCPHIYLDPTNSHGGEMILPFYFHKNNLSIPDNEWNLMGKVMIRSLNALRHANAAAERVTISILAWAEDVHLSIPTVSLPEMGKEVEEANDKGYISGPATALAAAAGALTTIPPIAPYAKATQMAMTTTANVAKIFGLCRPPHTVDSAPYKPKAYSDLAVTTIPDGVSKLTVDDQQELSIDPRLAGLGAEDPLSIKTIASRESYLTSFNWSVDTVPDNLLFNARVSPIHWAEASGTPTAHVFPACCMAAMPFEFWTGTIKFRFQIVASSFHRGRLRFVYDPNVLALSATDYNVNYMEIVDIAEKKDFTISITNAQTTTFLEKVEPGPSSIAANRSATAPIAAGPGNGVLGVYVMNELTTPSTLATNDVEVNVFISAGDDFEVAVPYRHFAEYVAKAESGLEVEEDSNLHQDKPEADIETELVPNKTWNSQIYDVYFGEAVKSFRPLLKRYTLHECVGPLATGGVVISGRRNIFPYIRGAVTSAVHLSNGGLSPYNYVNTVLLHWVTLAHQGWRGGMRYKIIPRGAMNADNNIVNVQVERQTIEANTAQYVADNAAWDFYTTDSDAAKAAVVGSSYYTTPFSRQSFFGANGTAKTMSGINVNMEFEAPFQTLNRFVPGKTIDYTGASPVTQSGFDFRIFTNGGTTSLFEIHVAAAEDFQVYFWTGLPRMYWQPTPPAL